MNVKVADQTFAIGLTESGSKWIRNCDLTKTKAIYWNYEQIEMISVKFTKNLEKNGATKSRERKSNKIGF